MKTASDLLRRFEQLNAIGSALSTERDIGRLLEKILLAAKKITHADGGTLYLVSTDRSSLQFEIVRNGSLKIALGGSSGNPITFAPLALLNPDGTANVKTVAAYSAVHKETINIGNAYEAEGFDFAGMREFDKRTGYRSTSFLTVPMKNHEDEVIGVLQLINALDPETGQVVTFSAPEQRLAESLASQAAIALTNRQLIQQQEQLFESFISMINYAIDDKSPYTGGHCERVPVLTMMLAEAVEETNDGPFASFKMSDQDRYELKIAGLLHDCGKITTPVHVVDKSTKLETIFDRIELIDTRFEVLKRDAEIAMLRAKLSASAATDADADAQLEAAFSAKLNQLDTERAFLRNANLGSEAMGADDQQEVRNIATRHQWRNPQGQTCDFLTENEVTNLAIRSGTLTQAEREIINNHIVVTIRMLESLPWVKTLKRVPEFAGGHHERMDGKGYPRGLTRDQMSVQARIMGIADIFEALTAKDRPYKHGKTLAESIEILARMSRNGHIDPDLFDIFIQKKVYLAYGERFLGPDQLDVGDDATIAGYGAST